MVSVDFLPICDILFNFISLASYFCDVAFDIIVAYTFYRDGLTFWFLIVLGKNLSPEKRCDLLQCYDFAF